MNSPWLQSLYLHALTHADHFEISIFFYPQTLWLWHNSRRTFWIANIISGYNILTDFFHQNISSKISKPDLLVLMILLILVLVFVRILFWIAWLFLLFTYCIGYISFFSSIVIGTNPISDTSPNNVFSHKFDATKIFSFLLHPLLFFWQGIEFFSLTKNAINNDWLFIPMIMTFALYYWN